MSTTASLFFFFFWSSSSVVSRSNPLWNIEYKMSQLIGMASGLSLSFAVIAIKEPKDERI